MHTLFSLLLLTAAATAADVPVGEVIKFTFDKSKIFPGTTRDVWVYVPKQYDGNTPACLHVNQDGIQFGAVKLKDGKPAEGGVFDKLIAEKKMPVMIGVFVRPGVVKAILPGADDRINRSFEYDSLSDHYARFLIDELLPHVETLAAADGRKIKLSKDGNDRSIGGSSSGAIAAFTAAWERPDAFRRVFSSIGSYADLRGGHEYAALIRKVEPKPLRIYLEDGSGDLNNFAGDWFLANQQMEKSLKFMGYEVEHSWGTGGHEAKHATEIYPDAMTWLWKDHPKPVKTGECKNDFLREIIIPGEDWKTVGDGFTTADGIATSPRGAVYFSDYKNEKTYVITDGKSTLWSNERYNIQCFAPSNVIYALDYDKKGIIEWSPDKTVKKITKEINAMSCIATSNGSVYATSLNYTEFPVHYELWHISKDGSARIIDKDTSHSIGIAMSPDQAMLFIKGDDGWIISCQVQADGSLGNKQRFFLLHARNNDTGARGMQTDRDGRLWVATNSGIQVCDREGRVHCIIPTPNQKVNRLTFGGPEFDVLYITCGDKVYSRKVKVKGANAFEPPIKAAPPKK